MELMEPKVGVEEMGVRRLWRASVQVPRPSGGTQCLELVHMGPASTRDVSATVTDLGDGAAVLRLADGHGAVLNEVRCAPEPQPAPPVEYPVQQTLPPRTWIELEHADGKAFNDSDTVVTATVTAEGDVRFDGPVIFRPVDPEPTEWDEYDPWTDGLS